MLIVAVVNMWCDEPAILCHLAQSSVKRPMIETICGIHAPSSLLWPQGRGLRASGRAEGMRAIQGTTFASPSPKLTAFLTPHHTLLTGGACHGHMQLSCLGALAGLRLSSHGPEPTIFNSCVNKRNVNICFCLLERQS